MFLRTIVGVQENCKRTTAQGIILSDYQALENFTKKMTKARVGASRMLLLAWKRSKSLPMILFSMIYAAAVPTTSSVLGDRAFQSW